MCPSGISLAEMSSAQANLPNMSGPVLGGWRERVPRACFTHACTRVNLCKSPVTCSSHWLLLYKCYTQPNGMFDAGSTIVLEILNIGPTSRIPNTACLLHHTRFAGLRAAAAKHVQLVPTRTCKS